MDNNTSPEDRIRTRAYELWQEAGEPEGSHDAFWLAAEHEVGGSESVIEEQLDEALDDSFPASDPPSISTPSRKVKRSGSKASA